MSVIVRDDGFHAEDWVGEITEVPADTAIAAVAGLAAAGQGGMLRVAFPSFADGRGFTLGRRLRDEGFTGRLRAAGPVLADQYAMARRSGFDEVEIPDDLAARQPEDQWLFRADWREGSYRARLKG